MRARSRSRWNDVTKMDLKVLRCEDVDWIHLALDKTQFRATGASVI
jgi:hypothetical protein